MWNENKLTQLLNINYPIIQAPMSGISPPALIAEVSNAGGLGSLGAAQMTPQEIRNAIREIRSRTHYPFAVNLFVPEEITKPSDEMINNANKILNKFRQQLQIKSSPQLKSPPYTFNDQLDILLEEKVPVFSFTFGILPSVIIKKIKEQNIIVLGTATTTREAMLLESAGVDIIIAQGSEAGGHRGSAPDTRVERALIGTMALVPQIVDRVRIPVIASGGIMEGRGIVAALALGALGVQMGTAFLTCSESDIHSKHREMLLSSSDESTQITRSFTGRYVRAVYNRFVEEMAQQQNILLAYPWQRFLTKDITASAAAQNNSDLMAMWSGQGAALCRELSASDLMRQLVEEVNKTLKKLTS